ncbi:MAG: META domain-containing protein [Leptolyngbyaceae cyanobacterium bins.302]|nr:META domain-containing protein [Leptolyngbyaceae cyanobacterium bins.302]
MNKLLITRSMFSLAIGLGGIAGVNPALAQSLTETTLFMAQAASLQGSWRLANMTEPPFPTPMVPSTDLTAEFAGDRVAGSGGCNRFTGSFKTSGSKLTIGPLASTFKACEESVMTQEATFLKALQAAERYEIMPDGLQIFYKTDQGTGVLRFTAQSVPGLW